jgi:hypothetical protein
MSETKHAPEKWVAVPLGFRWHTNEKPIFENGLWQIVRSDFPERMPIATVDRGDDHDEQTRIDAEKVARLMAAAPTMLEALKEEVCSCNCPETCCGKMRAAIKLAEQPSL